MLNPNVTFPTIVLRYPGGGGSMRPPPVNFVVGHNCSSPPPQNIGRLGGPTGVGGRSQLHTTIATAPSVARNVTSLRLNMTLASGCCGLANAFPKQPQCHRTRRADVVAFRGTRKNRRDSAAGRAHCSRALRRCVAHQNLSRTPLEPVARAPQSAASARRRTPPLVRRACLVARHDSGPGFAD